MIDRNNDEARVSEDCRGVMMPAGPSGPAVRDDDKRQLVVGNGAILRAGDHDAADSNFPGRRVAWIPTVPTSTGPPEVAGTSMNQIPAASVGAEIKQVIAESRTANSRIVIPA
jgi:hypothetical protein